MKLNSSLLTGHALNWAVAKCEIVPDVRDGRARFWPHPNNPRLICVQTYNHEANPKGYDLYAPSTDWSIAGPIIAREKIEFSYSYSDCLAELAHAPTSVRDATRRRGVTPLIAAMRCYVASKLGDIIDIPDQVAEATP